MAIMWSNRQTAECTWFVSIEGYDTVSAWNAYLLSQSLPQECTTANIGSSTYPYRTWAAVVADSRAVTGEKVAVGLGRWGQDAQRTVWIKRMHWMGMTGTVIDVYNTTASPFKQNATPEYFDTLSFVNGETRALFATGVSTTYNRMIRCQFDYLKGITSGYTLELQYCTVNNLAALELHKALNCIYVSVNPSLLVAINCIMPTSNAACYYCCFTASSNAGAVSSFNILADPQFNNPAIGDYTLAGGSPCLYKGRGGAHIGALGEARTINPNSPEMADGVAIYSTTGGLTDLIKTSYLVNSVTMYMLSLRTGKMSGTVESGWIDLGRTREVDSLRFVADMIYGAGGNYAQAPSPDLNKLSVSYKAALTEAEKAGVSWVSTEWGTEDLAVSARYIKLLITVTSTTPAP
jgi:hypothetical protein